MHCLSCWTSRYNFQSLSYLIHVGYPNTIRYHRIKINHLLIFMLYPVIFSIPVGWSCPQAVLGRNSDSQTIPKFQTRLGT